MTQTNIIEMRGITKRFGAVTANKGINLHIPANTIHAIVGENGAGKSTIMKILYGFYTADEGEIWVDGQRRDIRNPHDFPDLDDPDWQYEDGLLAGIQAVRIGVRALGNRRRAP